MIRCCFFDIGNVCVFFDERKTIDTVAYLCGLTPEAIESFMWDEGIAHRYDTGALRFNEIHTLLEKKCSRKILPKDLRKAFCVGFSANPEIEPIIWNLKKKNIPMFAISNTCDVHFEHLYKHYPILRLFTGYILSYEARSLKPEPKIFQLALVKAGVAAKDCFYVDDIQEYTEIGQKMGMKVAVYRDARLLEKRLGELGI